MNNGLSARFGILIAVIVIVALLAGTWFVGISPRLSETAAAEEELADVQQVNVSHEATLKRLQALNDDLPSLRAELEDLRAAFPGQSAFGAYLREVEAIGAASGVIVRIVGFEGPDAYEASEDAGTANAELQAALGSVNPENFMTMSVTIQVEGAHAGVMDALSRLQSTSRYALIHDVQLAAGLIAEEPAASALVTGQLFILSESAPAPAATPEPTPAG